MISRSGSIVSLSPPFLFHRPTNLKQPQQRSRNLTVVEIEKQEHPSKTIKENTKENAKAEGKKRKEKKKKRTPDPTGPR